MMGLYSDIIAILYTNDRAEDAANAIVEKIRDAVSKVRADCSVKAGDAHRNGEERAALIQNAREVGAAMVWNELDGMSNDKE
jgi:hypothetical protein